VEYHKGKPIYFYEAGERTPYAAYWSPYTQTYTKTLKAQRKRIDRLIEEEKAQLEIEGATETLDTTLAQALESIQDAIEQHRLEVEGEAGEALAKTSDTLDTSVTETLQALQDLLSEADYLLDGHAGDLQLEAQQNLNEAEANLDLGAQGAVEALQGYLTGILGGVWERIIELRESLEASLEDIAQDLDTRVQTLKAEASSLLETGLEITSPFLEALNFGINALTTRLTELLTFKAEDVLDLQEQLQKAYIERQVRIMEKLRGEQV